jgi:hypothetical protein
MVWTSVGWVLTYFDTSLVLVVLALLKSIDTSLWPYIADQHNTGLHQLQRKEQGQKYMHIPWTQYAIEMEIKLSNKIV